MAFPYTYTCKYNLTEALSPNEFDFLNKNVFSAYKKEDNAHLVPTDILGLSFLVNIEQIDNYTIKCKLASKQVVSVVVILSLLGIFLLRMDLEYYLLYIAFVSVFIYFVLFSIFSSKIVKMIEKFLKNNRITINYNYKNNTLSCPACGHPLDDDDTVCPSCGLHLK